MPKYRAVIFVHGCYWHRHSGCKFAYTPKSRLDFWQKKFAENVARHEAVAEQLKALGLRVIVVWECELKDLERLAQRLKHELSPLAGTGSPSA